MREKSIKFGMYLTGYNSTTIERMYSEWLKNYTIANKIYFKPNKIEKIIFDTFNITRKKVYNKTRIKTIIFVRQLIQYFLFEYTHLSKNEIGKRTGGFDRNTVLSSLTVINNYLDTDKIKKNRIEEIREMIER